MITLPLPAHAAGLFLTHNECAGYYQTVGEWAVENEMYDWISDEQRQKAIAKNDVWTLQWYPDTPVGFCALAAADLDALLSAAQKSEGKKR